MTTDTVRRTGWVRLGAGTDWSMGLLGLGLSIVTAALIAAPTSQLIEIVSGSSPGWLVTALWIVPFVSLGFGTVNGPYVPQPWQIPVGAALTLSAAPILMSVLRWQRFMTGELARAGVEWRLLHRAQ